MARLIPKTGIDAVRFAQRNPLLPGTRNFSASVTKLTDTVTAIGSETLAKQRLQEANHAVQALTFERDEQGNLIAPTLPESDGFFGPSLFDEAYTAQAKNAYAQRIQLDARQAISGLANKHILDPDAFEVSSDAYIKATLAAVHPSVQGDVEIMMESLGVEHYNTVARKKAEHDFINAGKLHFETIDQRQRDLGAAIIGGQEWDQVIPMVMEVSGLMTEAERRNFAGEDYVIQAADALTRYVATAYLTKEFTDIPNNELANATMIKRLTDLKEGIGNITMAGKDGLEEVDIKDMFGTIQERQLIIDPVIKMISERETGRALLQQVRFEAESKRWDHQFGREVFSANIRGVVADLDFELMHNNAVMSGNNALAEKIRRYSNLNEINAKNMRLDDVAEMDLREIAVYFDTMTPTIQAGADQLSEATHGVDILDLMNGKGTILDSSERRRSVLTFISWAQARVSGDGISKERQRSLDTLKNRNDEISRKQIEYIEKKGKPESTDEIIAMQADIRLSTAGVNLNQSHDSAALADDMIESSIGPVDWNTISIQDAANVINLIANNISVIPATFSQYVNGIANVVGSVSDEDVVRMLDMAGIVYDSGSLAGEMASQSAFGPDNDRAFTTIFSRYPSSKIQPTEAIREIFAKIRRGDKDLFPEWNTISSALQIEMMDQMDELLDTEFEEFLPVRANEVGIGRNQPIPPELRRQAKLILTTLRKNFRDSGIRKNAVAEAMNIAIRDGGWKSSELGYSALRPEDGWVPFFDAGKFAWSQFAPEAMFLDEEDKTDTDAMRVIRFETNRVMRKVSGTTLKLTVNAFLEYHDIESTIRGEPTYYIVDVREDGTGKPVRDPDSVFGATLFLTFKEAIAKDKKKRDKEREDRADVNSANRDRIQKLRKLMPIK